MRGLLLLGLSISSTAVAQGAPSSDALTPLERKAIGCYALVSPQLDSANIHVRLDSVPRWVDSVDGHTRVLRTMSLPDSLARDYDLSGWGRPLVSPDSIEITLSNGTRGWSFFLAWSHDSLIGRAESFAEPGAALPRGVARWAPVRCPL
jgi:hypothetical protein